MTQRPLDVGVAKPVPGRGELGRGYPLTRAREFAAP
ncbi:hypothetical protein N602_03840 [Mycobacterium avium subsp. hominissuis 10-5606]|nr:hypothetical protein N602_03840 [Mycobacterium avium subsp. hominissuis 10-5606]